MDASLEDALGSIDEFLVEPPAVLNEEQRQAFDIIVNKQKNAFITGDAGTGKSYVLTAIVDALTQLGRMVTVTAPTGVAALNVAGVTIYKWAGVSSFEDSLEEYIRKIKRYRKVLPWMITQTLIIDEISMLHPHILTRIDNVLRVLRNKPTKPFGGIQVIVVGDFLQLPPVTKNVREPPMCFTSTAWHGNFVTCYLKTSCRQDNPMFIQCLRDIRCGTLSQSTRDMLNTRVIASVGLIYGSNDAPPTILYPLVADVERENVRQLRNIPGKEEVFMAKTWFDESILVQSTKDLESLIKDSRSPEHLVLKIGAQVMVTSNIDVTVGLVNGTRGVVTEMSELSIQIRLPSGKCADIIPITLSRSPGQGCPTSATFKQFPLVLAWAFTIHKSQGLTMSNFVVDLRKIFAEGQAYVALSRARNLSDFYILGDIAESGIKASRAAKEFYARLLGLSCTSEEKHVVCANCTSVFCDECSKPMSEFLEAAKICQRCLFPQAHSSTPKRSRLH